MGRFVQRVPRSLWIGLLLTPNLVAGPVLHEKFAPAPAEDLRLGATTPSGSMPAALQTRSGFVNAPEEARPPSVDGSGVYGGSRSSANADSAYHLDRVTTRPHQVQYDEPFRPSVLPFKRMVAFDALRTDMSLYSFDQGLEQLEVGGVAEGSEDLFFADLEVDLVAGVPVRIPSVGAGTRVRALHLDPPGPLDLLRDGAENWFARAARGGRARLVMQLSIERAALGGAFASTTWNQLSHSLRPFPSAARPAAREVLDHIGVDQSLTPDRAVVALVEYFRRFRESSELPIAEEPLELYRELSFSQKGVCRHRAYAFVVTALALGLPSRLVHNEAHAWVEVYDSSLWHRIDLGGAASNIQEEFFDPMTPRHRPPKDRYLWPPGATAAPSAPFPAQTTSSVPPAAPQASARQFDKQPTPSAVSSWPSAHQGTTPTPAGSAVTADRAGFAIDLELDKVRLLRGSPLAVKGRALRNGKACALSRIDIFVGSPTGPVGIGSVVTNRAGAFSGQVTLPRSTPVGPLDVSARVTGGCD